MNIIRLGRMLTIAGLVITSSMNANAQFGNILDKAKKTVGDAGTKSSILM